MGRTERSDSVLSGDVWTIRKWNQTSAMNNQQFSEVPGDLSQLASLPNQLPMIVCPGFNQVELTEGFVRSLHSFTRPRIVPGLPISPFEIYQWMTDTLGNPATQPPIVGIGFSAGVVGLAGALFLWQSSGGKVARLYAVDGWGVPVVGLSVVRISHDRFTHLTTLPLGAGEINFYADPAVDHLSLWGTPELAIGFCVPWWQVAEGAGERMSAKAFLVRSLAQDHAAYNLEISD